MPWRHYFIVSFFISPHVWKLYIVASVIRLRTGNRTDKVNLPSMTPLWRSAEFQEREIFDLYGIVFNGHPDLRRILCADDWVGWPLRKDYVFPREYHGIPGSVELDWQQQADYPK